MTDEQNNGDGTHAMLREVRDDVREIKAHVTGGLTPERGLNHRVLMLEHDRLESRRRTRNFVALCAALFSVIGAGLFDWIKGLFHGGHRP